MTNSITELKKIISNYRPYNEQEEKDPGADYTLWCQKNGNSVHTSVLFCTRDQRSG